MKQNMQFYKHLENYLKFCREQIKSNDITISMGNEACDPDSFISSLVFGMDRKYVFVVNMRKEIMEKKGDIMKIIELMKIDPDDLVYLERPRGRLSKEEKTKSTVLRTRGGDEKISGKNIKLSLIDHHHPVPELDSFEIDTVIDHHELGDRAMKGKFLFINTGAKSCATLVASAVVPTKEIAYLLSIPIVLDTSNFKGLSKGRTKGHHTKDGHAESPGGVGNRDYLVFKELKRIGGFKRKEMAKLRKVIKKARRNDAKQSTSVILQKDYKEYLVDGVRFGISTVKYSFKKWVDRNEDKLSVSSLKRFMEEQGLDGHMVNYKRGKDRYFTMVNCRFEDELVSRLGLESREYKGFRYYKTRAEFSRKVIAPEIKRMIRESYLKRQCL